MPIRPSDPIAGKSRGTAAQLNTYAASIGAKRMTDVRLFSAELESLCNDPTIGFDFAILGAHSAVETGDEKRGGGWLSDAWEEWLNPAGIGITDGELEIKPYRNGTEAARAYVVHMYLYVRGLIPKGHRLEPYISLDPRYDDAIEKGYAGIARVLSDLQGRWWTNPRGTAAICDRGLSIWPNLPDANAKGGTMALYRVAGLTTPIELPVPLIVDLIPTEQTNQRPGIKRQTPGYWVQHETGNPDPGAGAAMHSRYLDQGAPNQYGVSQKLSYHFTVDSGVIYQKIPIDEVTWQAADGDGQGNMSGISCELCINPESDKATARHNAEALAGGVMRALGMGVDRVKRHWDFNSGSTDRHHCPDLMMSEGYWPTFVENVGKIIAKGGTSVPTVSGYPSGMDAGIAGWLFGRYQEGGKVYEFNEKGPVSQSWLKYGAVFGYTRIVDVWLFADGREYYRFESFTLWRPNHNESFRPLESEVAA
jgi:hypothetical protein